MRTIWLHAGIRKAGSTAIQDFLCKNKQKLFQLGYHYPTNFHPEAKKSYQLGISGLPQCGNISHIITNSTKPEKETMEQMIGGLKVPEDKDVILSNENFFFITLNQNYFNEFKRVLLSITKNHQVKIILYLRRQDEILESMYRQDIQDINKKDFKFREDYSDNLDNRTTFNFKKYIDAFAEQFGKENVIIRAYEKEQLKNNNTIADFIDVIRLKNTKDLTINHESNISFSHEIVEYLRISKTYTPVLHKTLANYLTQINPKVKSKKISMASPNIKRKVIIEYEKMNDEIAKKYLKKDKLFLKPIPDGDNSWKPYEMDVEDAVKVSALVFISLTQKVHALQDQVNILRQVLKKYLEAQ